MLTGEGADEAFGGYNRYRIPSRVKLFKKLHDISFYKAIDPFKNSSELFKRLYFKTRYNQLLEYTSFYAWHEAERLVDEKIFLNKDLSLRESLLTDGVNKDIYSTLLYYDQTTYLPSLLDRQDKLSMANSVEARVPYTDRAVYEFANSLPASLKFKKRQLKYILRKIAEKYLPKELIYRRKNGLNLPLNNWLNDKRFLGKHLDLLLDKTARKRGLYNTEYLQHMIKAQEAGDGTFSVKLALLINFELWHRIFFKS